jgi:hypothetical protein
MFSKVPDVDETALFDGANESEGMSGALSCNET